MTGHKVILELEWIAICCATELVWQSPSWFIRIPEFRSDIAANSLWNLNRFRGLLGVVSLCHDACYVGCRELKVQSKRLLWQADWKSSRYKWPHYYITRSPCCLSNRSIGELCFCNQKYFITLTKRLENVKKNGILLTAEMWLFRVLLWLKIGQSNQKLVKFVKNRFYTTITGTIWNVHKLKLKCNVCYRWSGSGSGSGSEEGARANSEQRLLASAWYQLGARCHRDAVCWFLFKIVIRQTEDAVNQSIIIDNVYRTSEHGRVLGHGPPSDSKWVGTS